MTIRSYPDSLARLVGIPSAWQSEFFRFAQEQYGFIYEERDQAG